MKKTLSDSKLLIVKKGISLVAVFAVLVVSLVAISPNLSFGWFSAGSYAEADGMEVMAQMSAFDIYYRMKGDTTWQEIDLSSPISVADGLDSPGTTATFEIKLVNKGAEDVTINEFGMASPTAAEEVANEAGVYLSTELFMTLVKVASEDGTKEYTLNSPPPLDESGQSLKTTENINYMQYVSDTPTVTLASEEDVVFEISIMFLNRDYPQNEFKNFGVDGDGVCARRLYLTFERS